MTGIILDGRPWQILHGDVRKICKLLPSNYFDAMLSDPPYGLSFMGRRWDYAVPSAAVWSETERVLKPGAHAMIFGGPRTFHRVAVAVEDGGFIPRDLLMWMFGSGFPKSADTSKALDKKAGAKRQKVLIPTRSGNSERRGEGQQGSTFGDAHGGFRDVSEAASEEAKIWEGFGTALKPGYEPIVLARKMLEGTVAENVLKWGVGSLAIDDSRIEAQGRPLLGPNKGNKADTLYEGGLVGARGKIGQTDEGRWPANVILDEESAALLDAQSGVRKSGIAVTRNGGGGKILAGLTGNESEGYSKSARPDSGYSDTGGASRFYYTAKADRYQREAGLKGRPLGNNMRVNASRASEEEKTAARNANTHPTVKPIDLIRYLATLILPPKRDTPRRILVPFAGVSSEMIGCIQAGWDEVIGIEREAEYIEIAKARITKGGVLTGLADRKMRRRKS